MQNNNYNRVKKWRQQNKKLCPICNINKIYKESKTCRTCYERKKQQEYKSLTIKQYQERLSVKNKHSSWLNAHVRQFNRIWNKDLTVLSCCNCGYNKHVELAHIKSITSYNPELTTLGEVNDRNNIIQLCPNCHWEFDNDLLTLKDIKDRS